MKQVKSQQYSSLAQDILKGECDPGEDTLIKKIFSNREVLAYLLVTFVEEYMGCSRRMIMEKYLPKATLSFGKEPVHAGEGLPDKVPVANTEDTELREGMVRFDVLLTLPVPRRPGKNIVIMIDIEVQKNDTPGYKIEKRMIYYLCRMVSGQRGKIFMGSDYDKIVKCYSLWLCPNLRKSEASSIDCYAIKRMHVFGKGRSKVEKSDYDLIEGICCKFNNKEMHPENAMIRYLQLLLTNVASPHERLDELHNKFGISKTREAEEMCNYSLFLIERGIEKGMEKGRKEGKEEEKLEILEQLMADHYSDRRMMRLLKVDAVQLNALRKKLTERKLTTVTTD